MGPKNFICFFFILCLSWPSLCLGQEGRQYLVTTSYQGASTLEVEDQITYPLSATLMKLANLEQIQSRSTEETSILYLSFAKPIPRKILLKCLEEVRKSLPSKCSYPVVRSLNYDLLFFKLQPPANQNLSDLFSPLEIIHQLVRHPGIRDVFLPGYPTRRIEIRLSGSTLSRYNLSSMDVVRGIKASLIRLPAGKLKGNKKDYLLQRAGQTLSLENLSKVILSTTSGGNPIYLRDVSRIQLSLRFSGKSSSLLVLEVAPEETYKGSLPKYQEMVQKIFRGWKVRSLLKKPLRPVFPLSIKGKGELFGEVRSIPNQFWSEEPTLEYYRWLIEDSSNKHKISFLGSDWKKVSRLRDRAYLLLKKQGIQVRDYPKEEPSLEFDLDRRRLARYGISVATLADYWRTLFSETPLGYCDSGKRKVPLILMPLCSKSKPQNLNPLSIPSPRGAAPLLQLVTIRRTLAPRSLESVNGRIKCALYLALAASQTREEVLKILKKNSKLPEGCEMTFE